MSMRRLFRKVFGVCGRSKMSDDFLSIEITKSCYLVVIEDFSFGFVVKFENLLLMREGKRGKAFGCEIRKIRLDLISC